VFLSGEWWTGKSFLLNYLIRFLEAGGKADWMVRDNKEEEQLSGTDWR
jgi:hypothetical protein